MGVDIPVGRYRRTIFVTEQFDPSISGRERCEKRTLISVENWSRVPRRPCRSTLNRRVALEDDDVAKALAREVQRDRRTHDPGADDDNGPGARQLGVRPGE